MTDLPYTIVDAFTQKPFTGNPAAVVIFTADDSRSQDEALLQSIAAEFALSETAFLVPNDAFLESLPSYHLRWLTPTVLCGHATLASAQIIYSLHPKATEIKFSTLSGILTAERTQSGAIGLNFPADQSIINPLLEDSPQYQATLESVLKSSPTLEGKIKGIAMSDPKIGMGPLVEIDGSVDLERLDVDVNAFPLMTLTQAAPASSGFPVYSRFFGPSLGVPEDPVTGSAHAYIAPYWLGNSAALSRLPKGHSTTTLRARQVSKRGGEMEVSWNKDTSRVVLSGWATVVMKGTLIGI